MSAVVGGSCLCGALAFECTLPTKWVAHCHCSLCRRAHGAAFVTWAGLPDAQFRVTAGEAQLHWYRSTPEAERGFCATCGSTLFFRSSKWPGEMHVVVSNLHAALDRAPQAHVNWNAHVDWYVPDDALPRKPST
jgi:hypothetical protein